MKTQTTNERAPIENNLRFLQSPEGALLIQLKGDWKIGNPLPSADELEKKLTAGARVKRVGFDTSELKAWDSGWNFYCRSGGGLVRYPKTKLEKEKSYEKT